MKILVITETLNTGGAELFTLRLVQHLRKANLDATLLSINKVHENPQMTSQFNTVPIIRFNLPFVKHLERLDYFLLRLGIDFSIKYLFQKRQLQHFISKHKYDIVHTHSIQIDHLVSQIRKENNCFRHVVTVHGDYSSEYLKMKKGIRSVWLNLPKKLALLKKHVDYWIFLSDEQKAFFIEVMQLSSNFRKVYNGFSDSYSRLDDSKIKNFVKKDFVFGMIARGEKEKGWDILINTFNRLPLGCKLILAGEGRYLDTLRKKYSDNTRIFFAGFYPDPVGLLKNIDVLVLPTLYPFETLPTIVIEALYAGVPVIASDIHEIKRMITDDETSEFAGYLIPFNGINLDADELYARMLCLYENPQLLEQFSKVAKKAFRKFDINKCIENYTDIYKQLLQRLS
jgi:glycosyltransferase involved in cell wall biosynthesis